MKARMWKKLLSASLAGVMALSMLPMAAMAAVASEDAIVYTDDTVTYQGITFQRETEGTYQGLPLFDAEPDHLDEYLDVYMDYIGLDGMVRIALEKRGDYTLVNTYTFTDSYGDENLAGKTITWENDNAGKVIPGSPKFSSPEGVQGISTNFPAQIGVGQTWNKDLVAAEGNVVGTEKLYKDSSALTGKDGSYLSNANQMVSTALTDIRANPLSGRIDEGYAEDPYLASIMSDTMAAGVTGHDQTESDDGFWQMAFVDTKHFSNYLAQWQRNSGSFYNSARGLLEYMTRSTYKGFENNNFGCFMTSYGTTNYVPNGMSPLIAYVLKDSDAGDFTGTTITEQAFTTVTANLEDVADLGNETLYFVFKNPELRLASFSAKTAAVSVTGVKLSQETASLTVGGTLTLTATVEPEDATNKNVTWSSDNESVATVDGGKVTAVSTGTANITVPPRTAARPPPVWSPSAAAPAAAVPPAVVLPAVVLPAAAPPAAPPPTPASLKPLPSPTCPTAPGMLRL